MTDLATLRARAIALANARKNIETAAEELEDEDALDNLGADLELLADLQANLTAARKLARRLERSATEAIAKAVRIAQAVAEEP